MIARTSLSAKADRRSGRESGEAARDEAGLPLDDLLDARFDEAGRLAQIGRGNRQRVAERLDPRPPAMSADELERAVQKLAQGLEAIERQSNASPRQTETKAAQPRPERQLQDAEPAEAQNRDFVTYSLDRLEARLEALSKRLQERGRPQAQPLPTAAAEGTSRTEPPAQSRSSAWYSEVAPAESAQVEANTGTRPLDVAGKSEGDVVSPPPAATEPAPARIAPDAGEVQAEIRAGQPEREAAEPRPAPLVADHPAGPAALRQDGEINAAEARQQFAALQVRIEAMQKTLDGNQIEPVRREMLELLHQLQDVGRDGRAIAGAVAEVRAKLDDMETKLNAARNITGNRISELQDRLSGLTERLGDMEAEIPGFDAVRENQFAILERFDRMEGLVHRLASPEEMLERVDAMRRQLQTIASQREMARVEAGIVQLAERLDALPEQLSNGVALERIERQLHEVASEFAEARRERVSGVADLDRRLAEISAGLTSLSQADHTPDFSGLEERLSDIFSRLDDDRQFAGDAFVRMDGRLAALGAAIEAQENHAAAEVLAALTEKMDRLAEAIEAQDAFGARRDLEGLGGRLDLLSRAVSEQAEHLSRPQLAPLEERLDAMQAQLEELALGARDSSSHFGPLAEKLQEIAERLSGIGAAAPQEPVLERLYAIEERLAGMTPKNSDPRALHTQLEGIVSRLELLKGRSIDPARLTELFERVDAAMRAGRMEERFDRIEQKLDETGVPADQLHRIERRIAESAGAGVPEERLQRLERHIAAAMQDRGAVERLQRIEQKLEAGVQVDLADDRLERLERKLDEINRISGPAGELLTQEDLADLRGDIIALRRELRSLPGVGDGQENLAGALQAISERLDRLPKDPPVTAADLENHVERLARLLDDPSHSRLALAHIESSLKGLEKRLDEARLSASADPADGGADAQLEIDTVTDIARALSDDVSLLRGATEASERRTKDALEAVHGTLEAVVKRMAFLERDSETAPAALAATDEVPPARTATPPAPVVQETERLIEQAAEQGTVEQPREPAQGGLFSRFTSSQLLKRATGGRADSFSPETDESDNGDEPLEPGTDAPLSSALVGAPSSDTALMSGARGRGKAGHPGGRAAEVETADARPVAVEPAGDNFLAAARRAAQAAAAEAVEAEESETARRGGLSRLINRRRGRRQVLLASVVAVALAFAAYQLIRNDLLPNPLEVAGPAERNVTTASVEPAALPAPPAPEPEAPIAAAAPVTSQSSSAPVVAPPQVASPEVAAAPEPTPPPPVVDLQGPERGLQAGVLPGQPGDGATDAPTGSARTVRTAALPPPRAASAPDPAPAPGSPEPAPAAPPAAVPPAAATTPASVPDGIGPERLRSAALAGDPVAALEVAARLAEGRGVSQDLPSAVAWYERAAEAGLAPAQYRLGSIFEKGHGVPKDLTAAMDWYRRAAEAGNVKAMHNLAVLYAEGAGGEPDLERAAGLFRQAAEHGVRDSQFNLAILHARGLGVPQDMIEAYKWFAVAADSGDSESVKRRDIIAAALSPEDLAKAEAAAAAFQPAPLITEANDVTMPEGGWGEDTSSVAVPSEADLVALVQKLLAEQGYDPGPPDGRLGRKTREAITSFQAKTGLPATGQIDAGLVAALKEEESS